MPAPSEASDMTKRLTTQEDAELRRLHVLIRFAKGESTLDERYRRLRSRDRRHEVRELRKNDVVSEVSVPYPAAPEDDARRPSAGPDRTSRHIDGAGPRV
jgi:hypothetical protein